MANPFYDYGFNKIEFANPLNNNACEVKSNSVQLVGYDSVVYDFAGKDRIILIHPNCELVFLKNASIKLLQLKDKEYFDALNQQRERVNRLLAISSTYKKTRRAKPDHEYLNLSLKYYLDFIAHEEQDFVRLSPRELGSIVGMQRETVCRKLTYYKRKNIIISRKSYLFLNVSLFKQHLKN